LVHTVRTGETAFDAAFGVGLFDYLADHPEAAALFAGGMAARTTQHAAAIVAGYDWAGFRTIVDIGGADGTLLTSILAAAPSARGVIFDQPRMQAAAERRIAAKRLQQRCTFTGGDFFASVPPGGDAYLLKYVLHDWDDTQVVAILRNVRRVAPLHTRLLVVEPLLPDDDAPALETAMMDVAMLAVSGGRERTRAEFAALYECSGFRLLRTATTDSPFWLIEGVPA
jgi:O-methyltransferase domain